MTTRKICTVSNHNLPLIEFHLERHHVPYRSERFDNKGEIGYRIFIDFNHITVFKELVMPEYVKSRDVTKADVAKMPKSFQDMLDKIMKVGT